MPTGVPFPISHLPPQRRPRRATLGLLQPAGSGVLRDFFVDWSALAPGGLGHVAYNALRDLRHLRGLQERRHLDRRRCPRFAQPRQWLFVGPI